MVALEARAQKHCSNRAASAKIAFAVAAGLAAASLAGGCGEGQEPTTHRINVEVRCTKAEDRKLSCSIMPGTEILVDGEPYSINQSPRRPSSGGPVRFSATPKE